MAISVAWWWARCIAYIKSPGSISDRVSMGNNYFWIGSRLRVLERALSYSLLGFTKMVT